MANDNDEEASPLRTIHFKRGKSISLHTLYLHRRKAVVFLSLR